MTATAFDLYWKIDNEGDDGLTWFNENEFEDPELAKLFRQALTTYQIFQEDMSELMNYLEEEL